MSQREEKVLSLHKHGYNCAQALICSYQDILPFEEKELFKLTEGLGRGVAGLEEMCCIPKEQAGSLCCHTLLKENKEKKRCCSDLLKLGIAILDDCLK